MDGVSDGSGPLITGVDVAGAMSFAHMTDLEYELARAKYALDPSARDNVKKYVAEACCAKWGGLKVDIGALSEIVVDEHIDSSLCKSCNGAGTNKQHTECKQCAGSGMRKRSESSNARRVGVSRQHWSRVWRQRLDSIAQMLVDADERCLRVIKTHLGEPG